MFQDLDASSAEEEDPVEEETEASEELLAGETTPFSMPSGYIQLCYLLTMLWRMWTPKGDYLIMIS